MKKILLVTALTLAAPAYAEQAMLPSHAVQSMAQAMADNFGKTIDALAWQVTTTTQAGVITGSVGTAVILTATDGTERRPDAEHPGALPQGDQGHLGLPQDGERRHGRRDAPGLPDEQPDRASGTGPPTST